MNEILEMIRTLKKKSGISDDEFKVIVASVGKPFDRVQIMNNAHGNLTGYDCNICHNKGIVYFRQGEEIVSKNCDCMKVRESLGRIKNSGLAKSLESAIIDLHKYSDSQPRDDHGRWTDVGGGDSSSVGGGSTLNENSKKPITPVTDENIAKVPNVRISGYTDEQCQFIQEQHKELLRYSRDHNQNKEVAFVFNGELKNRKEFKGEDDKIDFGNALYGKNLVVLHNHPRNSSYSLNDMIEFVGNDGIKTLTIVKNNGRVETLTKIGTFDKNSLLTELGRSVKKNVKTKSDSEYNKVIKKFLTDKTQGGIFQWQS